MGTIPKTGIFTISLPDVGLSILLLYSHLVDSANSDIMIQPTFRVTFILYVKLNF